MTGDVKSDPVDHAPLLEVRLLGHSPLHPLVNGLIIVALLFGSYLFIAINHGRTLIEQTAGGVQVNEGVWAAFVLSLIFSSAITLSVLGHRSWQSLLPDIEATLDEEGRVLARGIATGPARSRLGRSLLAFIFGVALGTGFNAWVMVDEGLTVVQYANSSGLWFLVVMPLLFGLAARSMAQLGDDDKEIARLVLGHVQVDLARLERLQVYGQLALRGALSWLVIAAVILLFFVYSDSLFISVSTLGLSLLAAGYAFAVTVRPVVKVASGARDAALEAVRAQIADAGSKALAGEVSETALSDLTAYEAWLEKRPVWPISAPITRRLALYGLIPVLAWFGAAAAELVLEGLAG